MVRAPAGLLLCASWLIAAAPPVVRLDEARTRLVLVDDKSAVSLALVNLGERSVSSEVELQWLSPERRMRSSMSQTLPVPPGRSEHVIPFPLGDSGREERTWDRLRYRVRAEGRDAGGTLALVEICPFAFELRTSAPGRVAPGRPYRINVQAVHPTSGRAMSGVAIRGEIDIDPKIEAQAVSDRAGLATLEFRIPEQVDAEQQSLTITGTAGDFEQSDDLIVNFDTGVRLAIQTDKPLYQPGQTLHMRVLSVNAAQRAAASVNLTLQVRDPEGTTAFSTPLTTNRFGVAAAEWQIPPNTRIGDYTLAVEAAGDQEGRRGYGQSQVKISRYDLPEFVVSVTADRPWYLPAQTPKVEVRAGYLFGKPVPQALVRVVQEKERTWNFREQKWDIAEGESQESETDAEERFMARLNLAPAFEDLPESQRYLDVPFTAYVTDTLSRRTEQRRFDVRVTREPVHVYLLGYYDSPTRYIST